MESSSYSQTTPWILEETERKLCAPTEYNLGKTSISVYALPLQMNHLISQANDLCVNQNLTSSSLNIEQNLARKNQLVCLAVGPLEDF